MTRAARRRPLPSGVYTTQLLPPRKPVLTVSDDHITDPVIAIRPRDLTTPYRREDVFNEVIHQLGILADTMRRRAYSADASGVELAAEYVKAMRDAEG